MKKTLTLIVTIFCTFQLSAQDVRYAGVIQYKDISEGLKEPSKVIRLSLYGNNLKILPKEILEFKKLEILSLGNNPKLDWPSTFDLLSHFDSLRILFLENNEMTYIPENISKLKEIRTIWLNNNQIKVIPIGFLNLMMLEEIRLDNNQISIIPEQLRACNFKNKIVNNTLYYEKDFEVVSENYNYKNIFNLSYSLFKLNSYLLEDGDTINRIDSLGLMQGIWKAKFHNQRSWQVEFVNGVPHGKFQMFNFKGSTILEGEYINGVKSGLWKGNVIFSNQNIIEYDIEGREVGLKEFKLTDSVFQKGQIFCITGVPFQFDKIQTGIEKDSVLIRLVEFLKKHENLNFEIVANCGIDQSNHPIFSIIYSNKVSKGLKNYFIDNGIAPERLTHSTKEDFDFQYLIPQSIGENLQNRRLELRISKI